MATPLRAGVLLAPFIGLILLFIAGWTGLAPSIVALAEASTVWVNQSLGWAFIGVGLAVLILTVFTFIRLDTIRIGGPETRAGHGAFTAIAIGVAASTSLGLLFWATAEPLYHVHQPPRSTGIAPLSHDAQLFARVATILHWAIIAHVLNALSLMVFGLAAQNLGRKPTVDGVIFRSPRPRIAGTILDGALVFFATLVAVGAFASCILALSGEMTRFGPSAPNPAALFALALAMVFVIFVAGARPIRTLYAVLARAALILMAVLMAMTLVLGPTGAILGGGLLSLWEMIWTLPGLVSFSGASTGDPWPQVWTINHWGSAMMLAPLIGLFLSRAARGFRVGQAVVLFAVIPAGITLLWITIFGGLAIAVDQRTGGSIWAAINRGGADDATYAALYSLPGGESLVVGFVFLLALAFATFAASMLYAVMRICAPGADDDPATGGARYSVATMWSAGIGLAGWGLASFGTGPVVDTLSRLGALPALILTVGLLFAALRLCARPRILNEVTKLEPTQIALDLSDVLPKDPYDDDFDEALDRDPLPRRRRRRKSA